MNSFYREIVKVFDIDDWPAARSRVGRVSKNICLSVVTDAAPGNTVLVCDGVAIAKMESERKENHVPGDSR
jgi:hydrogenase maturation factor